jgi:hypothetical protein
MSSLEGRVRAALRATAAEITPRDVPPLSAQSQAITLNDSARPVTPSGHSLRHQGWRHRAWRHPGWRHWGVPLAAAVAVLAVVGAGLGASLIARSTAGHEGRPPGGSTAPVSAAKGGTTGKSAPPAGAPPYGSATTLTQALVDEFMPASGAQFTAGATFMSNVVGPAEDTVLARCMGARGFPTAPGSLAVDAKFAGISDLTQFPDLDAIAKAGTLPGGEVVNGKPGTIPSAAYQAALQACMRPARDPFAEMSGYARTLDNAFLLTVLRIQSSAPQVRATIPALRACASKYGWPRDSEGNNRPLNTFGDYVTWVTTFLDGPASRGASNATMRALRQHWGRVFVECARPTVTVMEQQQLAAQRGFVTSHGTQVAHLVGLAIAAFNLAGGQ